MARFGDTWLAGLFEHEGGPSAGPRHARKPAGQHRLGSNPAKEYRPVDSPAFKPDRYEGRHTRKIGAHRYVRGQEHLLPETRPKGYVGQRRLFDGGPKQWFSTLRSDAPGYGPQETPDEWEGGYNPPPTSSTVYGERRYGDHADALYPTSVRVYPRQWQRNEAGDWVYGELGPVR